MVDSSLFWRAHQALIVLFYAAAAVLAATGHTSHPVVRAAEIILVAHVLELPLALRATRERRPAMNRLVVGTLLFGFFWWIPVRRGLFAPAPAVP